MRLSELRQRIADAIAPTSDIPEKPFPPNVTPELDALENPPLPPDPNHAQPLTDEQRANLEELRNRYAPDRQTGRLADQIGQRPSVSRGRQAVIDVFGDECPVCSHSVENEHCRYLGSCTTCERHCSATNWPPASVQRFNRARNAE